MIKNSKNCSLYYKCFTGHGIVGAARRYLLYNKLFFFFVFSFRRPTNIMTQKIRKNLHLIVLKMKTSILFFILYLFGIALL